MANLLDQLISKVSQAWDFLANPYHLYDISLSQIRYHKNTGREVAYFDIHNLKTTRKIPLCKILKKTELMKSIDPIERHILEVLHHEEKQHNLIQTNVDFNALLGRFLDYPVVETYFYSDVQKRHMLVIKFNDSDHETCLSIRELANMPDHINILRASLVPSFFSDTLEENATPA